MLNWLAKWHPQARLAVMFVLVFLVLQGCYLLVVLTLPTALTPNAATALLVALPMWVLTAGVATLYLFYNAFRLLRQYQRRYRYAPRRNLVVAWVAPFAMLGLIFVVTSTPFIESVFEWRRDRSFDASREDMVEICDAVLRQGAGSPLIRTNAQVGVFSQVRISLRNETQVWFDVGDTSGEVGYICLSPDTDPPQDDDIYDYDDQDERFIFFRERDDARRERMNDAQDDTTE
jgi:signal transduction histidine kinase